MTKKEKTIRDMVIEYDVMEASYITAHDKLNAIRIECDDSEADNIRLRRWLVKIWKQAASCSQYEDFALMAEGALEGDKPK